MLVEVGYGNMGVLVDDVGRGECEEGGEGGEMGETGEMGEEGEAGQLALDISQILLVSNAVISSASVRYVHVHVFEALWMCGESWLAVLNSPPQFSRLDIQVSLRP